LYSSGKKKLFNSGKEPEKMNRGTRLAAVLSVAAALLTTAGCNKLQARDQLNKGVQAYKSGNVEQSVGHFQEAVRLDPEFKVAKLYLAMAYMSQYVSGVETPDNLNMAKQAIQQYKDVLEQDPTSVNSLKGIAYLNREMKNFDQARETYKKALQIDPNDPDLYYSLGVIDWTQAYKDAKEIKGKAGLEVEAELKGGKEQKGRKGKKVSKDKQLCDELSAKDGPVIEEGMKMLETAIDKRQDYDEAMAYLNLLYRRKANDITCDDQEARAQYNKLADQWTNKAMAARKKKAEEAARKNQGGIILEATPTPSPSR
jgi:tetratricopeptide (TPR) repeat protein